MKLKITIKSDEDKDVELIKKYFFDQSVNHFRNRILRFYKTLGEKLPLNTGDSDEKIVEDYFHDIYKKNKEKIQEILKQSEDIINKKADDCLDKLVQLMDYKIEKDEEFIAMPTLLPFSPFDRPIFNFSIVQPLFLGKENEILEIAIHEISHFLFFDIMRKIGLPILTLRENPINKGLEHLYKETLTGVILSEPELENLLQWKNYLGNPETHNLYIKEGNNDKVFLREYLRKELKKYKQKGLSFYDFVNDTFRKFLPLVDKFNEKKDFWDKNEREIRNGNFELLDEYKKPILI